MARPRRPKLEPRLAAFRKRAGLTQEQVAEHIGVSADMVRKHERGINQPILLYRQRYVDLYGVSETDLGLVLRLPMRSDSTGASLDEIDQIFLELKESGTRDEVIRQLDRATHSAAEAHTQAPASQLLSEVLRLHSRVRSLAEGKQRLGQRREIFRIQSALLAHACLLLGDLRQNDTAEKFGVAALGLAQEAGVNPAMAFTALAKTLRWADRFVESADMAQQGFRCSPSTPVRTQLASQEANAAALLGDAPRAREALRRAEEAASSAAPDSGRSAWSFPVARQAVFTLSVATHTGDPDTALHAAAIADEGWAGGQPMVSANWAQIRVGAGIAHVLRGSLDEAVSEVTPVFSLPSERRVATVTAYMENLDRQLRHSKVVDGRSAIELRREIREFNLAALAEDPA
ncbi:hypothetical protein GCM10023321_61690 [Pseudonocardia eucalypti]|uniref:HTH cro/C1-type domain-containing protein n=1 Tax=Pseudonocardia eucalypti TaxID=648755 RepID=A0ABP9QV36_9PSEU|nr:transcriptional regulator with XRE-family HTH domain [Pseudonocardia eucalypti]